MSTGACQLALVVFQGLARTRLGETAATVATRYTARSFVTEKGRMLFGVDIYTSNERSGNCTRRCRHRYNSTATIDPQGNSAQSSRVFKHSYQ